MKQLIRQIMKFGVVGAIAFMIDYGVLMSLNQLLHVDAVIAGAISFCASLVFNYLASMRFVFSHRNDLSKQREFIIFVVLSLIGLILNELCLAVGVTLLGDSALMLTLTKIFATVVVMVWNFMSRKRWLDAGQTVNND